MHALLSLSGGRVLPHSAQAVIASSPAVGHSSSAVNRTQLQALTGNVSHLRKIEPLTLLPETQRCQSETSSALLEFLLALLPCLSLPRLQKKTTTCALIFFISLPLTTPNFVCRIYFIKLSVCTINNVYKDSVFTLSSS